MKNLIGTIFFIMFILIIIKTGSFGKAIKWAFGNFFKFWIWPVLLGVIGYFIFGKIGCIIGTLVGSIIGFKARAKKYDEIVGDKK